jgi:hypothetical protein
MNCHAGPPHHPKVEIKSEVGTCASCHREHRGRESRLSFVNDSTCTKCHADLDQHTQDKKSHYANKITSFSHDHPQFHLGPESDRQPLGKARDPGKLKFNHEAHLRAGVRYSEKDGGGWTLEKIQDKALRERYRKEQPAGKDKDSDLVQLTCVSCHQLESSEAPKGAAGGGTTTRTQGEYMQPPTYEQHCKACHPLSFDPAVKNKSGALVEVPHLLQPADVRRFLWGVYAEKEVGTARKAPPGRPLPGRNLTREEKEKVSRSVKSAESNLFEENLEKAIRFMEQGKTACALCHQFTGGGDKQPEKVVAPDVPRVWYPHSRFTHKAHRMAKCIECHKGAETSKVSSDVLLPGIENCRTCHGPSGTEGGKKVGGVRADCVTCHRYHNGESPEAGLGAGARGIKERRSLQQFLDGK